MTTYFNRLGSIEKSIHALTALAILAALFYLSFILNPAVIDNPYHYAIFIIVELYLVAHSIFVWWTILSYKSPKLFNLTNKKKKEELKALATSITVDVLIPIVDEPFETVKATILGAVAMEGNHKTHILDDKHRDDVMSFCLELGVGYFRRENRDFFKSGNLNNAIGKTFGEFVVVFDADFVPSNDFLLKLLPYFENPKVGLVQSPQYYRNSKSFVAKGASVIQNAFYELIMPGKNSFNAAFCVGTNVIYRRKALEDIGGIAQMSHSEDVFTSYAMHKNGWTSVYTPEILAQGLAPDTLESYFKQQLRWARGGFTMLLKHNPFFQKGLSLDQKIQYMSSSFYLTGFVILMFIINPALYLFFGIKPIRSDNGLQWFIHYIPFFVINFAITIYVMNGLKLRSLVLALGTFPSYVNAFFQVLIGSRFKWQVTNKKEKRKYSIIYPHIVVVLLSITAILVGAVNTVEIWTTLFAMFWSFINILIFSTVIIVFFKETYSRKDKSV